MLNAKHSSKKEEKKDDSFKKVNLPPDAQKRQIEFEARKASTKK